MHITPSLTALPHWPLLETPQDFIGMKGVCTMPVIPLRKTPSDAAEMVGQILYGECFQVSDADKGCLRIQRRADDQKAHGWSSMQGWIDNHLVPAMVVDTFPAQSRTVTTAHTTDHNTTRIPAGCTIDGTALPYSKETLLRVLDAYMGTPYLWGGQTSWGIDCSGLTQSVLAAFGHNIPRDSGQQATHFKTIDAADVNEAAIAFYGLKNRDTINHVGFLMRDNDGQSDNFIFIHAKQMVKAQRLDKNLMYPESAGKAELKSIGRIEW